MEFPAPQNKAIQICNRSSITMTWEPEINYGLNWLDFKKIMQVSVPMICDDSDVCKENVSGTFKTDQAEVQYTEEDKLRIGQLESEM
jgi:hypothetical protein